MTPRRFAGPVLRRLAGTILICEGVLAVGFALGSGGPPIFVAVALIAIVTGIGVSREVGAATPIGLALAGLLILSDVTSLPAALGGGASLSLPGIATELAANLIVVYALLQDGSRGSREERGVDRRRRGQPRAA